MIETSDCYKNNIAKNDCKQWLQQVIATSDCNKWLQQVIETSDWNKLLKQGECKKSDSKNGWNKWLKKKWLKKKATYISQNCLQNWLQKVIAKRWLQKSDSKKKTETNGLKQVVYFFH